MHLYFVCVWCRQIYLLWNSLNPCKVNGFCGRGKPITVWAWHVLSWINTKTGKSRYLIYSDCLDCDGWMQEQSLEHSAAWSPGCCYGSKTRFPKAISDFQGLATTGIPVLYAACSCWSFNTWSPSVDNCHLFLNSKVCYSTSRPGLSLFW